MEKVLLRKQLLRHAAPPLGSLADSGMHPAPIRICHFQCVCVSDKIRADDVLIGAPCIARGPAFLDIVLQVQLTRTREILLQLTNQFRFCVCHRVPPPLLLLLSYHICGWLFVVCCLEITLKGIAGSIGSIGSRGSGSKGLVLRLTIRSAANIYAAILNLCFSLLPLEGGAPKGRRLAWAFSPPRPTPISLRSK